MKYEFFTGSWSTEETAGITRFVFDTENGSIEKVSYNSFSSPYYMAVNASKTKLYVAQLDWAEGAPGYLNVFNIKDDGVELLQTVSSRANGPVAVKFALNERMLLTVHYSGESFQAFPIDDNGLLGECCGEVVLSGHSVNPDRQSKPHPHWIEARGEYIFVPDLGLDKLLLYQLDLQTGQFYDTGKHLPCPAGFGARQLAFLDNTNNTIYMGCELGNHIVVYQKVNGEYVTRQIISTVPKGYDGPSTTAGITAFGGYVYIINRDLNNIAMFKIKEDGLLEFSSLNESGGMVPRELNVFGDYLMVANTDSNKITALKINAEEGRLEPTGWEADVTAPTCIVSL